MLSPVYEITQRPQARTAWQLRYLLSVCHSVDIGCIRYGYVHAGQLLAKEPKR